MIQRRISPPRTPRTGRNAAVTASERSCWSAAVRSAAGRPASANVTRMRCRSCRACWHAHTSRIARSESRRRRAASAPISNRKASIESFSILAVGLSAAACAKSFPRPQASNSFPSCTYLSRELPPARIVTSAFARSFSEAGVESFSVGSRKNINGNMRELVGRDEGFRVSRNSFNRFRLCSF